MSKQGLSMPFRMEGACGEASGGPGRRNPATGEEPGCQTHQGKGEDQPKSSNWEPARRRWRAAKRLVVGDCPIVRPPCRRSSHKASHLLIDTACKLLFQPTGQP